MYKHSIYYKAPFHNNTGHAVNNPDALKWQIIFALSQNKPIYIVKILL